jgi:hypothetical protein
MIRRLQNSLCPHRKHVCRTRGYKWSLLKVREGKYKGSMVVPRGIWRQRVCLSSPGAFKTYTNLWEGRKQVIPIQLSMNGEGHGFPRPVRVLPEPKDG